MSRESFTSWLVRHRKDATPAGAVASVVLPLVRLRGFPRDPLTLEQVRAWLDPYAVIAPHVEAVWNRWQTETGRDIPAPPPEGVPAVTIGSVGLPASVTGVRPGGDFEPVLPYEIRP